MNNIFYTYHLIDTINFLPFYVGKGYGRRMYKHEWEVKNNKLPNNNKLLFNKINKILIEGRSIIYKKVLEDVTEKISLNKEIEDIKKYGRRDNGTGILCNMTDGGEGLFNPSNIVRNKMRESRIGKHHSKSTIKKMSLKKLGKSWEEIYGISEANRLRERLKNRHKNGIMKVSKTVLSNSMKKWWAKKKKHELI